MARRGSPYGGDYGARRRAVLGLPCSLQIVCSGARSTSADHFPPLAHHIHVNGSGCCELRPACTACQLAQGGLLAHRIIPARPRTPEPSRQW